MNIITSKDNLKIKNAAKLLDKKHRREQGRFLCEGLVMLNEAKNSGSLIEAVFCLEEILPTIEELSLADSCQIYVVPENVLSLLTDVKTPQGVVFICHMPCEKPLDTGCTLVLDNLRDCGNLGTIMRTAEGLGLKNIALLGDCAEVYNPKTVRASMGSVFRLTPVKTTLDTLKSHLMANKTPLLGAALEENSCDIRTLSLKNAAVVIGNEAKGISSEVLEACDGTVIIPMSGAQSFNASIAAAIIMWEMVR